MGGVWTRRTALWGVALVSQLGGLVLTFVLAIVSGSDGLTLGAVLPGALAGLTSMVAIATFYKALSVGIMSIVAPVSSLGVIVPVLVGVARGERPSPLQTAGMALAVIGAVLASSERSAGGHATSSRLSIGLALAAALSIGACYVGLGLSAEHDAGWGVFAMRATATTVFLMIVLTRRPALGLRARDLPTLALIGLLDNGANYLFALATTHGYLSVVSVVGYLYPAFTVLLAQHFLHERLAPWQWVGVAGALGGAALIGTA